MDVRGLVAVGAGKMAATLSRTLGLGGGTSYPGELARRLDPRLLATLAGGLSRGNVVVTGTNGKTTTSRLIASLMRQAGWRPVHNRSGANLLDGVASALLAATTLGGQIAGDSGLFEVDEAHLPAAVAETHPQVVVITNLFRDQLDRYGEIDHVARLWRAALAALPPEATAVLNADDPLVAGLAEATRARVLHFGLEYARHAQSDAQHAADSKRCLRCGAPYRYRALFYGHVGHYACPGCGWERPHPAVSVRALEFRGVEGSDLAFSLPSGPLALRLRLPGLYNVYNALAAVSVAHALGLPPAALKHGVEGFSAAFGRLERVAIQGRSAFLALVKNPVGFNEVLRTLCLEGSPRDLVIAINDNLADGTDISWLWDVDFERLQGRVHTCLVTGTRAEDMRLRLKYAGVDLQRVAIDKDLRAALHRGVQNAPPGGTLFVLPTYTAMLEARQILADEGYVGRFWED